MAAVVTTYIYHHYQIVITESPQSRFFYTINNPYSNDTVYHFDGNFADQTSAQNAAEAFVDALPANTCKPFIEAVVPGHSDAVIDAIMSNKYIIKVAEPHNEFTFQQDWD